MYPLHYNITTVQKYAPIPVSYGCVIIVEIVTVVEYHYMAAVDILTEAADAVMVDNVEESMAAAHTCDHHHQRHHCRKYSNYIRADIYEAPELTPPRVVWLVHPLSWINREVQKQQYWLKILWQSWDLWSSKRHFGPFWSHHWHPLSKPNIQCPHDIPRLLTSTPHMP